MREREREREERTYEYVCSVLKRFTCFIKCYV